MNSRHWIVLLVIGGLAVASLGMMAKFAVESDYGLRKTIEFKSALVTEFSGRGVSTVSLKRKRPGRTYALDLTGKFPAAADDQRRLDEDLGEYFVKKFHDRTARALHVTYRPESFWGLQSSPEREVTLLVADVRRRLVRRERKRQVAQAVEESTGCNVRSQEFQSRVLAAEVEVPQGNETPLASLTARIESVFREKLGRRYYNTLVLHLVGKGAETAGKAQQEESTVEQNQVLVEARFDARGTRLSSPSSPESGRSPPGERRDGRAAGGGARPGATREP